MTITKEDLYIQCPSCGGWGYIDRDLSMNKYNRWPAEEPDYYESCDECEGAGKILKSIIEVIKEAKSKESTNE